ncbi:MAG: hypothetical protein LRY27_02625 [Chitinophagales bacterium]|nr:hypothetical protein [Chitinophagales bacterium]
MFGFLYNLTVNGKAQIDIDEQPKIIIVGNQEEALRARNLLNENAHHQFLGFISVNNSMQETNVLGNFQYIKEIVNLYEADEIIFCNKDLNTSDIFNTMISLGNKLNYKILPESSESIIGSNSKNAAGDLYALDVNLKIDLKRNRMLKRLFDISMAILLFITLPVHLLYVKNKKALIKNCWEVLIGKKSWVGFANTGALQSIYKLPKLKPGVINPLSGMPANNQFNAQKLNLQYAKNYSVYNDFQRVLKGLKFL